MNALDLLPLHGNISHAGLSVSRPEIWPFVEILSYAERQRIMNAQVFKEQPSDVLTNRHAFEAFILDAQKIEQSACMRFYWLADLQIKYVTGWMAVTAPSDPGNILTISYDVLPSFDRMKIMEFPFAWLMLNAFKDGSPEAALCMESKINDSGAVLIAEEHGFRSMGSELCSTTETWAGHRVRRFMATKSGRTPPEWPLPALQRS